MSCLARESDEIQQEKKKRPGFKSSTSGVFFKIKSKGSQKSMIENPEVSL